jgi:hypothetical protein
MDKGDQGTTRDGDNGQTREVMHDTDSVVPKLSPEMQMAPRRLAPISEKRKEELRQSSKRKMQFMEQEYWRVRNGRQEYMRCPYCAKGRHGRRRNFTDKPMCCTLFAKAFGAILERQNQVDVAASHVRNIHQVGLVH